MAGVGIPAAGVFGAFLAKFISNSSFLNCLKGCFGYLGLSSLGATALSTAIVSSSTVIVEHFLSNGYY